MVGWPCQTYVPVPPKLTWISWNPYQLKPTGNCSASPQAPWMSIAWQFQWWETPARHAQQTTPKSSATSAEIRTTWNQLEIVRYHPRYHEWELPDSFSGGKPLPDTPKRLHLYKFCWITNNIKVHLIRHWRFIYIKLSVKNGVWFKRALGENSTLGLERVERGGEREIYVAWDGQAV